MEFSIKVDGKECFRYNHAGGEGPIKLRIETDPPMLYIFSRFWHNHYPLEPITREMEPWL